MNGRIGGKAGKNGMKKVSMMEKRSETGAEIQYQTETFGMKPIFLDLSFLFLFGKEHQ